MNRSCDLLSEFWCVNRTPLMKKFPCPFLLLTALMGANALHRITSIPPSFDELVNLAQVIFQGVVTDVRSQWVGEGAQRSIVSYVTFKVEDAMKGNPGSTYTMRMLGGTVGDQTMEVTDSPKFKVGNRDVLFVENNGSQFVPLVGIMHGRFRVEREQASGREVVTTNEGEPLSNVSQLGKNKQAASAGATLSIDEFKAAIHTKLAHVP